MFWQGWATAVANVVCPIHIITLHALHMIANLLIIVSVVTHDSKFVDNCECFLTLTDFMTCNLVRVIF